VAPAFIAIGIKATEKLLSDPNPEKRITAYRALQRANIDILPFAKKLANDPTPVVRREVALSMRGRPASQSAPILLAIAKEYDGKDKNYLEAIGLGAENHEDAIWKTLHATLGTKAPEDWSDNFARLTWRLWPAPAVPALKVRALSSELTPDQRTFAVESISFINHRSAANAMLELAAKGSPVHDKASYWLRKRATGAWQHLDLMSELAKRNIYDLKKIVVNPITVPAPPAKPSFSVKDVLALKGDATRGKATIMRCVMCHQIDKTGANYGPPLKGWGLTQTREVIARSIIDPSADIAHGFDGKIIKLKKGGEVHGLLINNRSPFNIKSTGGVTQIIPGDRINGRIQPLKRSLMLSADQLGLKPQDVADIVEYMKQWK
jgi:putative heme-binding domain-containing protein